jgi:serine/threonine protein kinase
LVIVPIMGDQPGELINGRYRLVEVIGQGAMGTVWRGHDEMLDREVAIKKVLLSPEIDDEERAALKALAIQEARATARLSHPGVITVYDVIEHDDAPVIVMELLKGRSLAAILQQEVRLPWKRVAVIGAAMVDALREAHEAGIVHRDLKPANVLIAGRRIVITDFGIAQRSGEQVGADPGDVTGTPAFMAPEQAENAAASPAADMWSLGATLFNAVEGRPPYEGPDYATVLLLLLAQDPPEPQRAGPLRPLITSLLHKDPALRPTAGDVADQVDALLHQDSNLGALAQKPPTPPSFPPPDPSRPYAPTSVAPPKVPSPGPAPYAPGSWAPRKRRRRGGFAIGIAAVFGVLILLSRIGEASHSVSVPPPTPSYGMPPFGSNTGYVGPVTFSPNGDILAVASGNLDYGGTSSIELYDTRTLTHSMTLPSITELNTLAFSPAGGQLAVGSADGTVGLWDLGTRQKTATINLMPAGETIDNIHGLVFSKDGKTLFTCDDHGQYGQWTIGRPKPVITTIPGYDPPGCDALSPDGGTLATGGVHTRALSLWRKHGSRLTSTVLDTSKSQQVGDVQNIAFSPDRKTLAALRDRAMETGITDLSAVEVWDLASHKRIATREVSVSDASALTFSQDGKTLALTTDDGDAELWNFRDPDDPMTIPIPKSGGIDDIGFSPDGRHFATTGEDGQVRFWDLHTHDQLASWSPGR